MPKTGKSKKCKNKFSLKKVFKSVGNKIRDQDMYGQPINLNFDGEETYNTIPGGLISIIFLISILSYALLKTKFMVNVEEWQLIQQNVLQTNIELNQIERMRNYSNVTLGLQFKQKRKMLSAELKKKLNQKVQDALEDAADDAETEEEE